MFPVLFKGDEPVAVDDGELIAEDAPEKPLPVSRLATCYSLVALLAACCLLLVLVGLLATSACCLCVIVS